MKAQLAGEFEMKDLGELNISLEWELLPPNSKYGLVAWITLRKLKSRSPTANHAAPGMNHAGKAGIKEYQTMVGSLVYAMLCTSLDLAYAIQQLSQCNSNPTNGHTQAAKRIFRYL